MLRLCRVVCSHAERTCRVCEKSEQPVEGDWRRGRGAFRWKEVGKPRNWEEMERAASLEGEGLKVAFERTEARVGADDGVDLEEWVLAQAVAPRDGVGQERGPGHVHVRAARQQQQHRAGNGETLAARE